MQGWPSSDVSALVIGAAASSVSSTVTGSLASLSTSTTLAAAARLLDEAGPGLVFDEAGPGLDEAGPGLDEAGPGLDDAGPGLDEAGPGLDDAGPGLDEAGPGLDDAGPGLALEEAGPGLDEAGPGLDEAAAAARSAATLLGDSCTKFGAFVGSTRFHFSCNGVKPSPGPSSFFSLKPCSLSASACVRIVALSGALLRSSSGVLYLFFNFGMMSLRLLCALEPIVRQILQKSASTPHTGTP